MKKTVLLAVTFGFVFLAFTQVHAAIIWDDYAFKYEVQVNSSQVFQNDDPDPVDTVIGSTPISSNQDGRTDSVNSSVISTGGPDSAGLGMALKAGAGGSHLTDGVKLHAYAEISTLSGGVLSPYGVEPVGTGTQEVIGYDNRNFHMDAPETCYLRTQLTGSIKDPEFYQHTGWQAGYNWQGGVKVRERIYDNDGNLFSQQVLAEISLEQLLTSIDPVSLIVNLRTDDGEGREVDYALESEIDLDTTLCNFMDPDGRYGDISPSDIGFLGKEGNPLDIEVTITPVPIPAAGLLLLSGIGLIIGVRNRTTRKV
jgi:hypothetical protein